MVLHFAVIDVVGNVDIIGR